MLNAQHDEVIPARDRRPLDGAVKTPIVWFDASHYSRSGTSPTRCARYRILSSPAW